VGEVGAELEDDRYILDAAELADVGGEDLRPTAGLAGEDGLQGLALARIGALVDVEAHAHLGLAGPDVALEGADGQEVEAIELDIAVMAGADMPGEHADAGIIRRRLRELAGAGNVAAADIEPVADKTPRGDAGHGRISLKAR
jgi:hypothetical protein